MKLKTENMEQTILEAAEKLFLEKGFSMTSTTEIAKEAGCNQALVHYYYRTKDKLFDDIFENKIKSFLSAFSLIESEDVPFLEKLKRIIGNHFDIIRNNPKVPFLFINEITTNPKRLETLKDKILALPGELIRQLTKEMNEEIRKGGIRQTNIFDLMISVFSMNIVLFIIKPALVEVGGVSVEEYEKLLDHRREENIRIILKSLEP